MNHIKWLYYSTAQLLLEFMFKSFQLKFFFSFANCGKYNSADFGFPLLFLHFFLDYSDTKLCCSLKLSRKAFSLWATFIYISHLNSRLASTTTAATFTFRALVLTHNGIFFGSKCAIKISKSSEIKLVKEGMYYFWFYKYDINYF